MDTFLTIAFSVAVIAWLVLTLERTHRRTGPLSRTPFGADLESDRDIARTLAEIDAVRARQEDRPAPEPGRPTARRTRRDWAHLRAL